MLFLNRVVPLIYRAHVVKEDFMVFICHISPSLPKAKRDGNCPEL